MKNNKETRVDIIRKRSAIGWPEETIARYHKWDLQWVRMIMHTYRINMQPKSLE